MRRVANLLLILLLLLLVVASLLFAVDNDMPVSLNFLQWQTPELSVFVWLIGSLILGIVLGVALAGFATTRQRLELRRLRRQAQNSQKELAALRTGALKEAS